MRGVGDFHAPTARCIAIGGRLGYDPTEQPATHPAFGPVTGHHRDSAAIGRLVPPT